MARGNVVDVNSEKAARAALDAENAWVALRDAVDRMMKAGLKLSTVIAILADEVDVSEDIARTIVDCLAEFPDRHMYQPPSTARA